MLDASCVQVFVSEDMETLAKDRVQLVQVLAANGGQPTSLRPGLQRRLANVGADLDRQVVVRGSFFFSFHL
jgi:hypothetical protein